MKWSCVIVTMDNGEEIEVIRMRQGDACSFREFENRPEVREFIETLCDIEEAWDEGTTIEVNDLTSGKMVTISGAHITDIRVHAKEE